VQLDLGHEQSRISPRRHLLVATGLVARMLILACERACGLERGHRFEAPRGVAHEDLQRGHPSVFRVERANGLSADRKRQALASARIVACCGRLRGVDLPLQLGLQERGQRLERVFQFVVERHAYRSWTSSDVKGWIGGIIRQYRCGPSPTSWYRRV